MTDETHPITPAILQDPDNYATCECGNTAPYDYMVMDPNEGHNSCPLCVRDWLFSLIDMYRDLLRELADPQLSHADIDARIKAAKCDLIGITEEEFDDLEYEI